MSTDEVIKFSTVDPDHGRKLTLDNVDIHIPTHDMTEEHQNLDAHYCSLMSTENRVSGLHLSDAQPICELKTLEAFYLLCQINSTLSPRASHRLIWNRFYKTKSCPGGNIPLDLALEHFNRLIKILIRNLGPNGLNKRAIDRYCDALAVNKSILDNFDTLCGVTRRSGKHYCRSVAADLQEIVKELLDQNALVFQEKRDLSHFQGFQDSLLSNSDLRSLFKWITTHKKNVHLKKCAR